MRRLALLVLTILALSAVAAASDRPVSAAPTSSNGDSLADAPLPLAAVSAPSVAPSTGYGVPDATYLFSATYVDPAGWGDLRYVEILVNTSTATNACVYARYDVANNVVQLHHAFLPTWLAGLTPGSATESRHNYGKLIAAQCRTAKPAPDTLVVTWALQFSWRMSGTDFYVYLRAEDSTGAETGLVQRGAWTVNRRPNYLIAPLSGLNQAVLPGALQIIDPAYRDLDLKGDLDELHVVLADSLPGPSGPTGKFVWLKYDQTDGLLYAYDTGAWNAATGTWGAWTPGVAPLTSFRLQTEFVQVNGPGSRLIIADYCTLRVRWFLVFKDAFIGRHSIYMRAVDKHPAADGDTGWKWKGWIDVDPLGVVSPAWLTHTNLYRVLAGLPPVTSNRGFTYGDRLHARYMVKNGYIGHDEDPANAWYTPEGDAAAHSGNAFVTSLMNTSDESAIDAWMQGPFHAIGIIDPRLHEAGFGSYREAIFPYPMAAMMDVIRGRGDISPLVTFPVMSPGVGSTTFLTRYASIESPDPIGCCGYTAPSGPPIFLMLGDGSVTPHVTAHSFKRGATTLEHCVYDETTYTNMSASQQAMARSMLGARDAIVLIPRQPLAPGATYTVSITANGVTHAWSFRVSPTASP